MYIINANLKLSHFQIDNHMYIASIMFWYYIERNIIEFNYYQTDKK